MTVIPYDQDHYGREVATIHINGVTVNEVLVRKGFCMVYRKHCKAKFCVDWLDLEKKARAEKKGLWSDPNALPPWDYRKKNYSRFESFKVFGFTS